ncbi:MAG: protein kinase domain-containing protein [Candidatus Methylumidiphilus sp.]
MAETFKGQHTGKLYTIDKELGSGGEGTVYLVRDPDRRQFAAKWRKPGADTQEQHRQLEELVRHGTPAIDDPGIHFCWPMECLSFDGSSSCGYVMPLIDRQKFFSLNQICTGRVKQPNLPLLCRISRRIVAALEAIHAVGLAYCDVNQGNFMFDPVGGEIEVCDNDNVVVNHSKAQVRGVWEFMAPEVALGRAAPNAESDLYSIAVLLYYLWMWEHPMEGQETMKLYSWDIPAKKKYFAESPLFVFHPHDARNTVRGNPELALHLTRWTRLCPPKLQLMFTETFVEAVHDPARRKRLNDWRRLFLELEANAPTCACGAVNLWDGEQQSLICWKCQQPIALGLCLRSQHGRQGESVLLAYAGASLRRHHLDVARFDAASSAVEGVIEAHPKEPGHCIIRNQSPRSWNYVAPDGTLLELEPGKARALIEGVELRIGAKTILVRRSGL